MTAYLNTFHDLTNPELISVIDELPLWSAPFGLKLLDTIKYRKNIKVLDIGFGLGFPLTEIAMRLGNTSRIYGIDPWDAAIERTHNKLKIYNLNNVSLSKGVAEDLPYEDSFFDLIVSNNGLNNVADLDKTFKECQRVARKGAQFVFTFNTSQTFKGFYDLLKEILLNNGLEHQIPKIDLHINQKRPPLERFRAIIEDYGFTEISVEESCFSYQFADADAVFSHFLINLAFLPSWKELIPEPLCEKVFAEIAEKINQIIQKKNVFIMNVPFYTLNCSKT